MNNGFRGHQHFFSPKRNLHYDLSLRTSSSTKDKNTLTHNISPKSFDIRSFSSYHMNTSKADMDKIHFNINHQSKIPYGERLYHKCLATQITTNNKTKALQSSLLKREMKQCTFKPNTLKVVGIEKYINQVHYKKKPTTRNHSKSTSEGNLHINQSFGSKVIKENAALSGLLYNTQLIGKGTKLNKKTRNKHRPKKNELILHSIKLFNDSKRRKEKQTENIDKHMRTHYPFRPLISKSQEKVPAKKYYQKDSMINFFHRLQAWLTHHNTTLKREFEEELYDRDIGFRLYSPQVNHISLNDHKTKADHTSSGSITKWEELYLDAKKRQTKTIQTEANHIESIFTRSNSTYFSPRSKEIITSLLKKVFNKIFQLISPNGNYLNKNSIDLEGIDVKVIEVLFPLFYELEEKSSTMNAEEFYISCIALYQTVTVYEKNVLLEWYFSQCKKEQSNRVANSEIENPLTFKPKITANGMHMKSMNSTNVSVIRETLSRREMGEMCTFRFVQCGSICNITPIDLNGSNRITEEL